MDLDEYAARAHVATQLADQARACAHMGSPLYAYLLTQSADDVEAAGPVWSVLRDHVLPGRGNAVALRFMAAVHRLVLDGRAPDLAVFYPSVGGGGPVEQAWPVFRDLVDQRRDEVSRLAARGCQTNEVGRAAALLGGFFQIAERTGRPLRLLEIGASAGLNLRWDRFRYDLPNGSWGDASSPLRLVDCWDAPPPMPAVDVRVVSRRGCDPAPVDPLDPQGRMALAASVWADQRVRFERLQGAIEVAARIPATVDTAEAQDWLPARLAEPAAGIATVVYHSVVFEYLDDAARGVVEAAIAQAGARATPDAPLAWLRMEPDEVVRTMGVRLTTWPGGRTRLLATATGHGMAVRWRNEPA